MPISDVDRDHDLLIKLDSKVSFICKSLEEVKQSIKDIKLPCGEHADCIEKINSTPRWGHLIILITFLSSVLGSILFYNFKLDDVQFQKLDYINERVIRCEQTIHFIKPKPN